MYSTSNRIAIYVVVTLKPVPENFQKYGFFPPHQTSINENPAEDDKAIFAIEVKDDVLELTVA